MLFMDWGDALMHGTPWIGLVVTLAFQIKRK